MKNAIILILFTGLIFFLGWWISDESLNPVAQRLVDKKTYESAAYNYLLGIGVPEQEDPARRGNELARAQHLNPAITIPDNFVSLRDHALLCEHISSSCFKRQRENVREATQLLEQYNFLIQRYRHFLSLADFSENTPSDIEANFPNYRLLISASRMQSLAWSIHQDSGDELATEIEQLRRLLSKDHNLLSKIIVARILDEKIQLAGLMIQEGNSVSISNYQLSKDEISLRTAILNEFRIAASIFDKNSAQKRKSSMNIFGRIAWQLGVRENMTLNHLLIAYRHYASLSENPAQVIAEDEFLPEEPGWLHKVRNPVGNAMLAVAYPDMKQYLVRIAHLDAKLRLLSWLRHPTKNIRNPWSAENGVSFSEFSDMICFKSSYNTEDYNSCLPRLANTSSQP